MNGQIVRARVVDYREAPYYRLLATVGGTTLSVAYLGTFLKNGTDIAVRVGLPNPHFQTPHHEVGYFLTSKLPPDFKDGSVDTKLLVGQWPPELIERLHARGHDTPRIAAIRDLFEVGKLPSVLYLQKKKGTTMPVVLSAHRAQGGYLPKDLKAGLAIFLHEIFMYDVEHITPRTVITEGLVDEVLAEGKEFGLEGLVLERLPNIRIGPRIDAG